MESVTSIVPVVDGNDKKTDTAGKLEVHYIDVGQCASQLMMYIADGNQLPRPR